MALDDDQLLHAGNKMQSNENLMNIEKINAEDRNDFSNNIKSICFNCIGTILGDYLLNFKNNKLAISCTIKKDNYNDSFKPQIMNQGRALLRLC